MSFCIFMSTDNVTIIIWSVNFWKPPNKHKHLMNTKSIITGWWSYATNNGLSSTLWHGNVDQRILTIWWSWVPDNVAAVGPLIYGVKEEMVGIFHVLSNRPIKNDLGNNRDDNRKKLESKKMHNENTIAFNRNVEFQAE